MGFAFLLASEASGHISARKVHIDIAGYRELAESILPTFSRYSSGFLWSVSSQWTSSGVLGSIAGSGVFP